MIQGLLTQEAAHLEVKDAIINSRWDWDWIPFVLPADIRDLIQAIPMSITSKGSDRLAWMGSAKGGFDVKSAYSLSVDSTIMPPFSVGWIWKINTLPRIKTFLWRCVHDSIGVKGCLARKGVVNDDICSICQEEVELVLYALRDCPQVRAIWLQLGVRDTNQSFLEE